MKLPRRSAIMGCFRILLTTLCKLTNPSVVRLMSNTLSKILVFRQIIETIYIIAYLKSFVNRSFFVLPTFLPRTAIRRSKLHSGIILYISASILAIAASTLTRVSSFPITSMISVAPPGVICLPETAVRTGHITNPGLYSWSLAN